MPGGCVRRPVRSIWWPRRTGCWPLSRSSTGPVLAEAAAALGARQRARLIAAAGIVLAAHPEWGKVGVRFDVLLINGAGSVRRTADAFRVED
jgi:putative endonuclease